jgi:hypothetical protein
MKTELGIKPAICLRIYLRAPPPPSPSLSRSTRTSSTPEPSTGLVSPPPPPSLALPPSLLPPFPAASPFGPRRPCTTDSPSGTVIGFLLPALPCLCPRRVRRAITNNMSPAEIGRGREGGRLPLASMAADRVWTGRPRGSFPSSSLHPG